MQYVFICPCIYEKKRLSWARIYTQKFNFLRITSIHKVKVTIHMASDYEKWLGEQGFRILGVS